MDRRHFLHLATATALSAAAGCRSGPGAGAQAEIPFFDPTGRLDFDELWRTLGERYCYFGQKATDWEHVRAVYRPQAASATTLDGFKEIIRRTMNELYDAHTSIHWTPDGGWRPPWLDLRAEPHGLAARVLDVRDGSAAAQGGVEPGTVILELDGSPVGELAQEHLPQCLTRPDPAAEAWAYNVTLSGRRNRPRRLTIGTNGGSRELTLALMEQTSDHDEPGVRHERLDGGIGYIRIASFAEMEVIELFDDALEALRDSPGLIIDVRRNGGGDTAVSVPIMGRFITEPKLYAYMRRREGEGLSHRWREEVEPRGPFTYEAPVVVVTDFWSASLAEGFPMGMSGLGRGRVVGRPMMQLGAGVWSFRLDLTGVTGQYSAEPVYDIEDRPRDDFRPHVVTGAGEDILEAGLRELMAMMT